MMTGIPISKINQKESEKILKISSKIKKVLIGQDHAIEKVVSSIQRSRAGFKNPKHPIGSFMFLGPSGVGKTELAKQLAISIFDKEEALIKIDMSEYMERYNVSRLIGAPPGYVGYDEGGQLTEKVRRNPYSIILFDEIEKGHRDVYNLLLQILDEGKLTDSLGHIIDFKNTIIIMTSNIGTQSISSSSIGFIKKDKQENNKEILNKEIKKYYKPEFLNRIDDIVLFNNLDKKDINKIIDIEMDSLLKRIDLLGYTVKVSEDAKDFIAEKGYDVKFGARPLKRAIQKYFEDPLSEEIINSNIKEGDTIRVKLNTDKSELVMKISKPKTKTEKTHK